MSEPVAQGIEYSKLRARLRRHAVLACEVPVGHAYSFPLPTLRCGRAGIAGFASPTDRRGGGLRQEAPDRWWVMDAESLQLMHYARTFWTPLALAGEAWDDQEIPDLGLSFEEFERRLQALDAIMSMAAQQFFAGERTARGAELAAAVEAVVPAALLPPYYRVAPDFWEWLGRPGPRSSV